VLERPVYLRETADGLFKPVIYLTHKILEETVLSVAMALVFSMLVYIVVDLAVSRRSSSGLSPYYITTLLLERRKAANCERSIVCVKPHQLGEPMCHNFHYARRLPQHAAFCARQHGPSAILRQW